MSDSDIGKKRIVRLKEVKKLTGLSTSWIYAKMKKGEFPENFKIFDGGRACGWWADEIEEWLKVRVVVHSHHLNF